MDFRGFRPIPAHGNLSGRLLNGSLSDGNTVGGWVLRISELVSELGIQNTILFYGNAVGG